MGRVCFVCGTNGNRKEIGFHMVPKKESLKQEWSKIFNINFSNIQRSQIYICSQHFRPEDIEVRLGGRVSYILKPNAVPCADLVLTRTFNSYAYSCVVKKRRISKATHGNIDDKVKKTDNRSAARTSTDNIEEDILGNNSIEYYENSIKKENIIKFEIEETDFHEEPEVFAINERLPEQFVKKASKKETPDDEENVQEKACDNSVFKVKEEFNPEINQSIKMEQDEYNEDILEQEHQNSIEDCRLDKDFSVKQENEIFEDPSSITVKEEPELETSRKEEIGENIENTKSILKQENLQDTLEEYKYDLNSIVKEENLNFEHISIKEEFELETSQDEEEFLDKTGDNECTTNFSVEEEQKKKLTNNGYNEKKLTFQELLKLGSVHQCQKCDFSSSKRYVLVNHIVKCHSIPEHYGYRKKCELCDFSTMLKPHLTRHIECVHLKIKGYSCEYCDYSSYTAARVRSHTMKKHQVDTTNLKKKKC